MAKTYFEKRISESKLFKWQPNIDVLVAIITLLLTWLSYYGVENWYNSNSLFDMAAGVILFVIVTNIFLDVIFPLWWVVYYRKKPLSELGITTKFLIPSIILGSVIALSSSLDMPKLLQGVDWLPHLIVSALVFWEPLFVYGWLQSRYEKSFGIIPAIILAAGSFVLYQIGTLPIDYLFQLLPIYIVLGVLMTLTRNIFSLWPIYWCIGASTISIAGGMKPFGWDMVAVYSVALAVQIWYIRNLNRKQKTIPITK